MRPIIFDDMNQLILGKKLKKGIHLPSNITVRIDGTKAYCDNIPLSCLVESEEKEEKELDSHTKGYIFDSLVYRYKYAREKLAELEFKELPKIGEDFKPLRFYRDSANRDIMRFIQILNEAIGEHD